MISVVSHHSEPQGSLLHPSFFLIAHETIEPCGIYWCGIQNRLLTWFHVGWDGFQGLSENWDGKKRCYRTDGMNEFFRQIRDQVQNMCQMELSTCWQTTGGNVETLHFVRPDQNPPDEQRGGKRWWDFYKRLSATGRVCASGSQTGLKNSKAKVQDFHENVTFWCFSPTLMWRRFVNPQRHRCGRPKTSLVPCLRLPLGADRRRGSTSSHKPEGNIDVIHKRLIINALITYL